MNNEGIVKYVAIGKGKCVCDRWYASGGLAYGYLAIEGDADALLIGEEMSPAVAR